ncbi:class I SAM-dependent methyltransferase [Euzebya tangerina]|uniref:class I SAM-dependent methyltransferase n=1 Tax=Euzebya tangerina TaxID=591198 RepID=UPI000E31EF6C|nr:class I SAM-dependent methyltransferase [Euzebya tangerina]
MTPEEAFVRIHAGLDREGPGSPESTLRALRLTGLASSGTADSARSGPDPQMPGPGHDRASGGLSVLDLGCGPGAQTITLAEALPDAHIVAVDLHPPFIEEVERRAAAAGVADRVTAVVGDMTEPQAVAPAPVDLVWSEAAAYSIGFDVALRAWREVLRPGGVLAVSEAVWAAPTVPQVVSDFWTSEYPDMQPVQRRRAQALQAGYRRIGDFSLPPSDWEAYYSPLRDRVAELADPGDPGMSEAVAAHEREFAVYDAGGPSAVGYQFFVLRRSD